jgi:hypothetical protein
MRSPLAARIICSDGRASVTVWLGLNTGRLAKSRRQ